MNKCFGLLRAISEFFYYVIRTMYCNRKIKRDLFPQRQRLNWLLERYKNCLNLLNSSFRSYLLINAKLNIYSCQNCQNMNESNI